MTISICMQGEKSDIKHFVFQLEQSGATIGFEQYHQARKHRNHGDTVCYLQLVQLNAPYDIELEFTTDESEHAG